MDRLLRAEITEFSPVMDETVLVAETGRPLGSRASRRLRAQGKIPGVVYGHGADPLAVAVDRHDFRTVLRSAGDNALIDLDLDGEIHLAIVKDLQRDPLRNRVNHIDFQRIDRDEKIEVVVPIRLVGEAEEVTKQRGLIQHQLSSVPVIAPAGKLPKSIEVDISGLTLDQPIRVGDLDLGEGVETDADPASVIVVGIITRAALAAEEEGEEGAEASEGAAESSEESGSAD
ncbi:MAG TPA: 50S ribosomal protein L25 [Acidimicrobiales bacterium]|nr:50S ribosomal protein L25 [Acidimicrobiales bacterium]